MPQILLPTVVHTRIGFIPVMAKLSLRIALRQDVNCSLHVGCTERDKK
jgi:hypothetical protein